ncbi:MAG: flagellar protein FliS [Chitinivibrionales bacterium]
MPLSAQADVAEYYTKVQIETASKKKAVYMLHERCAFFILKAQSTPGKKKFYCIKAQNILSQLQSSLRITDSISRGIFYLYDYCYVILDRGNDADLANALEIINVLNGAFRRLLRRP